MTSLHNTILCILISLFLLFSLTGAAYADNHDQCNDKYTGKTLTEDDLKEFVQGHAIWLKNTLPEDGKPMKGSRMPATLCNVTLDGRDIKNVDLRYVSFIDSRIIGVSCVVDEVIMIDDHIS